MRLFTRRDLDGFFGLFVDNLVQLLLIVQLCSFLCGMSGKESWLLVDRILPGAAASIIVGNLFYAWQAHRLAKRENRDDVTALPYGINTPSLLVFVFFVMAPTYEATKSAEAAWRMGLLACLGSGLIEFFGSFVAESVRRRTPRAALLSTLAGIAIGFISMTFALQIWSTPAVAMAPMAVVFLTYFAGARFPLGLPGGLVAILLGSAVAWFPPLIGAASPEAGNAAAEWIGSKMSFGAVAEAWSQRKAAWPVWCGEVLWDVVRRPTEWLGFLSVIIPMGLFNVIGSLQNIESAEAAGDRYSAAPSMAANGVGTLMASLFGSCFPTTIYIGHPGWKALGARAGYSTLNGAMITALCFSGTIGLVSQLIPIEAGIAIVLWIGVVITAQAFQATPPNHAPAVAVGLFPAIAAWGATVAMGAFFASGGKTMEAVLRANPSVEINGFLLHGLIVLERGYIFTCMFAAALTACLIERKFFAAAGWATVGAGATALGLTHAYQLKGNSLDYLLVGQQEAEGALAFHGSMVAVGYVAIAALFVLVGLRFRTHPDPEPPIAHL